MDNRQSNHRIRPSAYASVRACWRKNTGEQTPADLPIGGWIGRVGLEQVLDAIDQVVERGEPLTRGAVQAQIDRAALRIRRSANADRNFGRAR